MMRRQSQFSCLLYVRGQQVSTSQKAKPKVAQDALSTGSVDVVVASKCPSAQRWLLEWQRSGFQHPLRGF